MRNKERFEIKGLSVLVFKNEERRTVTLKVDRDQYSLLFGEHVIYIDTEGLIATATAHPDDEFSYSHGVELATSRLLAKVNRKFSEQIDKIKKDFEQFTAYVDGHKLKSSRIFDNIR